MDFHVGCQQEATGAEEGRVVRGEHGGRAPAFGVNIPTDGSAEFCLEGQSSPALLAGGRPAQMIAGVVGASVNAGDQAVDLGNKDGKKASFGNKHVIITVLLKCVYILVVLKFLSLQTYWINAGFYIEGFLVVIF